MTKSFADLQFQNKYVDRLREIREVMSPPRINTADSGWQVRCKRKIGQKTIESEEKRQLDLKGQIDKKQALENFLDQHQFNIRLKFAKSTLEDRLRWRHKYATTVATVARGREAVIEDFRRKQAQCDASEQRAEAAGALKQEVMNLRKTHRLLEDYRGRRKQTYDEAKRKLALVEMGELRRAETASALEAGGRSG